MKLYKFFVHADGGYWLCVQAEKETDARRQVEDIIGKKVTRALASWGPGTLEEYLGGDEFKERIKAHSKHVRRESGGR